MTLTPSITLTPNPCQVGSFRLAAGSTAGAEDHLPWRSVGWATSAQLTVPDDGAVTVIVVCVNRAGLASNVSLLVVPSGCPAFAPGAVLLGGDPPPQQGGVSAQHSIGVHYSASAELNVPRQGC